MGSTIHPISIMVDRTRTQHFCRFYNAPPDEMTLEMCQNHGGSHKAYGWNPQPDSRWDDAQYSAYMEAYDAETINSAP